MFGLEASEPAKKSLKIFQENSSKLIVELGAGLGRDSIFFAKNKISVNSLDYSKIGINIINKKILDNNLQNITAKVFDIRKKLPFQDNSIDACFSHMLYCMALTSAELSYLNNEIKRILGQVSESAINQKTGISFEIGEKVKVCDGPFASFTGLIEQIDEEKSRLKVSVSIFGRATPVDLEFNQVEKN